MAQFSVYYRMVSGKDRGRALEQKIQNNLPEYGRVQILSITDKQYENIKSFEGKSRKNREKQPQLHLFWVLPGYFRYGKDTNRPIFSVY